MVNKRIVALGVLLFVFLALALFSTFFYTKRCANFACFQDSMRKCDKVVYINEASEATWRYEIKGIEDGECIVEAKLLQLKEGDLSFERLKGYSMECSYAKGVATYPEKNLDKCHGRLKEEMQTVIIKRLHTYIVNNIGKIGEGLDFFRQ